MKSVKVKLIATVLTLFIVAMVALAGLNYWQAKKMLLMDTEVEITNVAQFNGEAIGKWFEPRKTELAAIGRSPAIRNGNPEAIVAYLAAEVKNINLYENILWVPANGVYYSADGTRNNIADRGYFKQAMNGETVISDPVISKFTGKSTVVLATPVIADGKAVGVICGAIPITAVEELVLGIKVAKTGYAYVIRGDGLTIIHPNNNFVNQVNQLTDQSGSPAMKVIAEKAVKGEKGLGIYEHNGVKKYLAYAPIPGTNWSIGVTAPIKEVTERLSSFTWISLITIMVVLLITAFGILLIAGNITKPLLILKDVANRIADGDLSDVKLHVNSRDELGYLAQTFEAMLENLRTLIRQIGAASDQVAAATEELTASAEQSAQAAGQVATSITDTAQGADLQLNSVGKALSLIQQMAEEARSGVEAAGNAADIAENAVTAAVNGNEAVDTAIGQMNSIQQTVEHSAQVVAELGACSKEIGQIVETISTIAGQTNLLALNAAIEAARAGAQGRGFAVVADEVRILAERSQEAAKQIAQLIGDIQEKTDKAVVAMGHGTQEVKRGAEVVDQAGRAFRDIDRHVKQVAAIIQGTADGMKQLSANGQDALDAMQETKRLSGGISDQAQNISAATQEQSASMEEIASSSQSLAKMAEELQVVISKFKI